GLGRLRAVLRLGERADAWASRRAVLAPHRPGDQRIGPRAWMRNGPDFSAARTGGRESGWYRSLDADAQLRAPPAGQTHAEIGPRRHPPAALRAAFFQRCHRAVRGSPVAARRSRSRRGARLGGPGAPARWHIRTRSRARCAELARIFEPRAAARARWTRRPSHAHRVGSSGSRPPADNLHPALSGTAPGPVHGAPFRADLSDVVGSADE